MMSCQLLSSIQRSCYACLKFSNQSHLKNIIKFPFKNQIRTIYSSHNLYAEESNSTKSETLVYEGKLRKRVKIVKRICLSTTMVYSAMLPSALYDLWQYNFIIGYAAGIVSLVFLSTPLLLHMITKSYVSELHYDSESKIFTAKILSILTQVKEVKFKAEDVTIPEIPGIFTTIVVNKIPLFVDYSYVKDYDAYSHMMGYDKPLEFYISDEKSDKSS